MNMRKKIIMIFSLSFSEGEKINTLEVKLIKKLMKVLIQKILLKK